MHALHKLIFSLLTLISTLVPTLATAQACLEFNYYAVQGRPFAWFPNREAACSDAGALINTVAQEDNARRRVFYASLPRPQAYFESEYRTAGLDAAGDRCLVERRSFQLSLQLDGQNIRSQASNWQTTEFISRHRPRPCTTIALSGDSSTSALPAGPALPHTAQVTENGAPAPNKSVSISLAGAGAVVPAGGTTDAAGQFRFTYIPPERIAAEATLNATCGDCINTETKQIQVTAVAESCRAEAGAGFGNPVEPASGIKRETASDYLDRAPHPLNFGRSYSSAGAGAPAGLGAHWSHSWAARLQSGLTSAVLNLGDGTSAAFSRSAAGLPWRPVSGVDTLLETAAGSIYTRSADESQYLFDATGKLLRITQRNGWAASLAYDAAGRLASVTNAFGRRLQLAYDSAGLLSTLTLPDGQTIGYTLDSQARLTRVQQADQTAMTYHYEDPRFPQALTGKTDESGMRYATFGYDANGQAISTQNAGGANRYSFSYPEVANPQSYASLVVGNVVDPALYRRTVQVTDALGHQQTWTYQGGDGQVRVLGGSAAFAGGQVANRSFVGTSALPSVETDFLGVQTLFSWDISRRLPLATTLAANRPEAQTVQTEWHSAFRLPLRVTEQGRTTAYTYDAVGNKLSETAAPASGPDAARTTAWTYNAQGLVESITDAKGGVTRFGYDAQGNRTSAINALNQETRYAYDAGGRVTQESAPNGLVTVYAYDARGRLLSASISGAGTGNESTAYTYTPSGQLASASLPNGYSTRYTYDAAQRLIGASDNRGNSISYTLDGAGNRVREEVKDPSGHIALLTSRSINQLNKVAAIQDASGQSTQLTYDANGEPIGQTDPLNQTTRKTLDGLKRPVATTFADNTQAAQAWNQLNQLTQVTDPKGIATQYQRNVFGEVTHETSPDIGSISYQRDALGDVIASTDARGISTQISRDALGRPTQVVRSNPAATASSQTTRYTWDSQQVGYLSQIEDHTGSTIYERDAQGRITSKTQTAGGSTLTTRYSYVNGNLASITYPSRLQVFYRRSASGQITGIDTQEPFNNLRRPSAITPFASNISYTALGQPKAWSWSSGDAASRAFDADGRMSSNEFAAYTFDAASRITSISQNLWASRTVTSVVGTGTATSTTTVTELYKTPLAWQASYDSRNRLTGFKRGGSDTRYAYDPNSNRLSAIEATTSDTDLDGSFDADDFTQTTSQSTSIDPASNKLLGFTQTLTKVRGTRTLATTNANVSYQLDAAGNLTSDGLRSFEYDPANRLSKLKILKDGEASSISYLHNSLGQRVFKGEPVAEQTLPNQAVLGEDFITYLRRQFGWLFTAAQSNASIGTAFTYADGQLPEWALLGEYDNGSASGKGRTEYLWLPTEDGGAVPVGLYRNGKFFAIHADHLGTPRLITNEANQPVWQWPYSAFGNNKPTGVLRATPNPRAAITNQPVLLRATNPAAVVDLRFPGQHADDEAGVFYNYQRNYQASQGRYTQNDPIGLEGGINRFGYVGGNPLSFSDPYGQAAAALFPAAALAVGAAGVMAMSTPEGRKAAEALVNKIVDACTPGDPCEEIRRQIRDLQAKLSAKEGQLAKDPYDLFNRAYSVNPGGDIANKGTYLGHLTQIDGLRIGLARKIAEAKAMGCL